MANISTITYNGKVIAETEEPGNVAVTYDGKTIANIGAGETKNILCNGKVMKTNLYIGAKTLLCEMAQMITDIAIAVKSAFPAEPTAYNLIGTYTSSQTWTAPEDGYFQIEVFGASGNGGSTQRTDRYMYLGSGGGGGGYACSKGIKLKKGDTIALVAATAGSTSSATIKSSVESYSALSVTSGGNASNSTTSAVGAAGAGGVASGGNYANVNGGNGTKGTTRNFVSFGTFYGGAGGATGYSGGNVGGQGGGLYYDTDGYEAIINLLSPGSGSAGFIKIYRGNTNPYDGPVIDPILENNSWEVISQAAKSGKAAEYWSVGDTKTFTYNGKSYEAQIIDFNHDTVVNSSTYGRSKAGITFQFTTVTADTNLQMFTSTTSTTNGWGGSNLKTTVENMVSAFNTDLQNVLVQVKIPYMKTYNATSATYLNTKIFIPSETELFGFTSSSANDDNFAVGSQYAYYAAGNTKVKLEPGYTWGKSYWTRTIRSSTEFTSISASGTKDYDAVQSYLRVSPIFCV